MEEQISPKRPKAITTLCVLGFIFIPLFLIGVFIPSLRDSIANELDEATIVAASVAMIISFIGLIGLWQMRRWGFYIFTAAQVGLIILSLATEGANGVFNHIVTLVVIGVLYTHIGKMR